MAINCRSLLKYCSVLCKKNNSNVLTESRKLFSTSSTKWSMSMYEDDEKAGYCDNPNAPIQNWEFMKECIRQIGPELKKLRGELIESIEMDPVTEFVPKQVERVLTFTAEDIAPWSFTSDADHGEGYSKVEFTPTSFGTAIFSGVLNTEVPKDGKVDKAGYCNICSPAREKSFYRQDFYDWSQYTHLVLKVRGDGRSYLLNLEVRGEYDVLWFDMYNYPLYTRGGPYWQITKIPFSKFLFSHKGRVQDKQNCVPQSRITRFGITICDAINAPFKLELAYVGLEYDPNHQEEFAYEMYETDIRIPDC